MKLPGRLAGSVAASLALTACSPTPAAAPSQAPAAPSTQWSSAAVPQVSGAAFSPASSSTASQPPGAASQVLRAPSSPGSVVGASRAFAAGATAGSPPAAAGAGGQLLPTSYSAGSQAPPVRIGVLEPLSGPLAAHGTDYVDGLNLYLASVHSSVADRRLEAVVADGGSSAATAAAQARTLVESRKVNLLTGLYAASECSAVAEYANHVGVPLAITGRCGEENLPAGRWVTRFTCTPSGEIDAAADWAAKNGFRKAILLTVDTRGGIETSDAFASAFMARGGHIVQEVHPAPDATDFKPFIAHMNPAGEIVVVSLRESQAVPFSQQYTAADKKVQILDLFGRMTSGAAFPRLGASALSFVGVSDYLDTFDSAANRRFVAAWRGAYGGRPISGDAASGYAAGQLIGTALKEVGGKDDAATLLQGLYYTDADTAKGRLRLDLWHDVIQSVYIWRIVGEGSGPVKALLQTYVDVGRTWDRTPEQLASFKFGAYKDKWPAMSQAQLGGVVQRRSLYQFFG